LILPNNNDDAFYFSDLGQYAKDNYATIRGDFKISTKDSVDATWYSDTSTWKRPGLYNAPSLSYSGYQVPHGAGMIEETHIFSSAMVNSLRVGKDVSNLYSPSFSNDNPATHLTTLNGKQIGIEPGWVAGQIFPKIIHVFDISGCLDVVENGADLRRGIAIFDGSTKWHDLSSPAMRQRRTDSGDCAVSPFLPRYLSVFARCAGETCFAIANHRHEGLI